MDYKQITTLFPAFGKIQNVQLREDSVRAMQLAMEAGGWNAENITLCPVTLSWKNCDISWVEHVTDVAEMCMVEFSKLEKYYRRHGVPFDWDLVVAGALLHDIGKLTEFVCKDGKAVHGEDFALMRHPLSGAILASRAGLPAALVHLIATHSFEGDKSYQTQESTFVRTIDLFTFNCSVQGLEKK